MRIYRKGAEANTIVDARRTFLLPIMSESEPAGKLIKTPGRVEAAATNPMKASGVPRASANGFKTGFLDIVELRIANAPIMHRTAKKKLSDRSVPLESSFQGLFVIFITL